MCYSYFVSVPDTRADGIVRGARHETTFVNYLRICFKWGGLPGFEALKDPPMQDIAHVTAELLAF